MYLKCIKYIFIIGLLCSLPARAQPLLAEPDRTDYQNVLNHFGEPAAFKDFDTYGNQQYTPLLDLGAWHGFMLPQSKEKLGSFTGPYVIAQEYGLYLGEYIE